jgi:hypothetical protein
MVEALEDGRLLSPVWTVSIWRHIRRPMPSKVEVQDQRSWKHYDGHAGCNAYIDERTACEGCRESYSRENLLICFNCLDKLCPRCARRPHRIYLG